MKFEQFEMTNEQKRRSISARDLAALLFRHQQAIVICFLAVLSATLLYGLFATRMYESSLRIFVRHGRQDPIVSADRHDTLAATQTDVPEEELYSEVELFKSHDILKRTVIETGLYLPKRYGILGALLPAPAPKAEPLNGDPDKDQRVVSAIRALDAGLKVQPIKKTNLIQVIYESPDPELAARVLNTLSGLYLQKHLAVNTPKGVYELFQKESDEYRAQLDQAENDLKSFVKRTGLQNSAADDQIIVAKMAEFQSNLRQTSVALQEARQRERQLVTALEHTPQRYKTQVRTDPTLLQQMKQTLLALELKRTQLAANFQPSYRPLQEVEEEIAQIKKAITDAETHPLEQETTDQEPTELWLRSDLVKTRTDVTSLEARENATRRGYEEYVAQVANLGQEGLVQTDLLRRVKMAEDNYLLYAQKQEEARITEALNLRQILNVAVVEPASVPISPSSPRWLYVLLLGGVLAVLFSGGLAFALDYADPTLRTPDEVADVLEMPVWAAVPGGQRY
jgi:uncharacterized protein involved in exopolysaccharide biosynthesis